MIPKDTSNNLGLVLEFKYETERQGQTQNTVSLKERLEKAADQALAQIDSRHYTSAFTSYPYVKTLLKVGIVFYKKQVFAKFIQSSSLNHQGPLA